MRSIFFGAIVLLASTAVVHPAQAEKHGYAQAFISHPQPIPMSRDQLIGVDQAHPDEDALTKRIEQDKTRLDRLIDICPSC
jgi:hypothetical protein